jgi:hypothetical protein
MTGGDSLNANLNVFYDVSAPEALPELELNKS